MRKKSIEEDLNTHPSVPSSNRLSRFLPSCKFTSLTVFVFSKTVRYSNLYKVLPVLSWNKLALFAAILYQEYSDVAINREIQRQQGKEPGTEEEGLREEGSDGIPSPSNLSPSSSFRSSRGSAFALWQDIPDVRSSGQLDNFSNEERKLQEVSKILRFRLISSLFHSYCSL